MQVKHHLKHAQELLQQSSHEHNKAQVRNGIWQSEITVSSSHPYAVGCCLACGSRNAWRSLTIGYARAASPVALASTLHTEHLCAAAWQIFSYFHGKLAELQVVLLMLFAFATGGLGV